MSFSLSEIRSVVDELQSLLPATVVKDSFVDFKGVPRNTAFLKDLNWGFVLESQTQRKTLVFSLKPPFVGMVLIEPQLAPENKKRTWFSAFDQAGRPGFTEKKVVRASLVNNDRIVLLEFESGETFEVHLFAARPNWIYRKEKITVAWRSSSSIRPPKLDVSIQPDQASLSSLDLFSREKEKRIDLIKENLFISLESFLRIRLRKLSKIRVYLEKDLKEAQGAGDLLKKANLIKAVLHEYPKKSKLRRVPGIDLELDEKQTLVENVDRLFSKYKKLNRTKIETIQRLGEISRQVEKTTKDLESIQEKDKFSIDFDELKNELWARFQFRVDSDVDSKSLKEKKSEKKENEFVRKGLRRFESKEGCLIWVGQNHEQNELLVQRLARGNDIWMHLKQTPGAHVVIQPPKNKTVPLDTLLVGAMLVAHYSGVKMGQKVDVDYTYRKYVKRLKQKGKGPFMVTYSQNKTLHVAVDHKKLEPILNS
ncbi:MAG: NFACT RNA binding domain-containing protein [Bacteriovoracia bacterium]